MKLGWIGTGIMGSRMAANLLKHGNEVVVYNRTKANANALLNLNAGWANSPQELAAQVDVLFTMLATPEAVQQAAFGENGFLDSLRPGALWADCSTVNPSFSRQMAAAAQQRQVRFVDAPVAGSKIPAEQGQLVFLVGGDAADVEVYQPFFSVMGKRVIHAGGHGMGASLKMLVNLLLGEAMAAFSEALVLGKELGFEQNMLLETLLSLPVAAPFLAGKRQKIATADFDAEFPLYLIQKDLHLAAITAYEHGVALPGVNAIKEAYALAMRRGLGNKDFSAIYQFLAEQLA
ncbi:2-hydroxy-3-oxopropionate reductase [Candidatus Moduliflexus flocculans]|uniref:2-hydroxy-3-oxopropionate reductase n=1 Tax=Candidatus Moduliflexus flocculans TaxID=1499966 RepID=A0A081BP59_9BACT|nr:2-hydroxy-3-oxopropionate reductase [Candidatus Moduliflexus flocculans]